MTHRSLRSIRFAIISVLWAVAITSGVQAVIYDIATDWSDASNPNGVWTYREGTNALPSTAVWVDGGAIDAAKLQAAWAVNPFPASPFIPAWFQVNANTSGVFDFLQSDIVVHSTDPASGFGMGNANAIWTSPGAGTIDISGGVWMARDIGRDNNWFLDLNGAPITDGRVFSGDPYSRASPFDFATGSGGAGAITGISVAPGDVLRLQIVKDTHISGDYVGVNWAVDFTAVPEPSSWALSLLGLSAIAVIRRRRSA